MSRMAKDVIAGVVGLGLATLLNALISSLEAGKAVWW